MFILFADDNICTRRSSFQWQQTCNCQLIIERNGAVPRSNQTNSEHGTNGCEKKKRLLYLDMNRAVVFKSLDFSVSDAQEAAVDASHSYTLVYRGKCRFLPFSTLLTMSIGQIARMIDSTHSHMSSLRSKENRWRFSCDLCDNYKW